MHQTRLNRRAFLSLVAASAAVPSSALAQRRVNRVALYAAVGPLLRHYDVDVERLTLTPRAAVTLPANVQYAWPHRSRRFLYVASSSSAAGSGPVGTVHHVSAFRINPATGALALHGTPIPLPTRPIHLTTDAPSAHVLVAFNNPSGLRVYRVNDDATLGAEVPQPGMLDFGVYGHQVRVTANDRLAILVARGNDAAAGRPEDPGALKVFRYDNGVLGDEVSIAPNGGHGFGPRHLDFHPTQPWVYVSLERQNKMQVYRLDGDRLQAEALFTQDTLAAPDRMISRQAASTVHVHPNGRFLYGANRADTTRPIDGRNVFIGGENNLVVYAIDQTTGAITPIQHVDTRGIHCRTFHIEPGGRMLVASHNVPVLIRDGTRIVTVPACLSVFRIGTDGRLTFVRKYDIDTRDQILFWMGMVPLPSGVP